MATIGELGAIALANAMQVKGAQLTADAQGRNRVMVVSPPQVMANNGQCAINDDDFQRLMQAVGPQGPQQGGYNAIFGTGQTVSTDNPYKGGSLATIQQVVPDNALAGQVFTFGFTPDKRARLTQTYLLRIAGIAQAGSPNGGQLLIEAYSAELTLKLNGFPVPQFAQQPLGAVLPTLTGTPQAFQSTLWVPADAVVEFDLRILENLNGLPGESTRLQMLCTSGTPAGALRGQLNGFGNGNGCNGGW